jgi:hypothetical protein
LDARKPDTTAPVLASIAVAQIGRLARDELLALDRVVAKELEEGSKVREGAVLGGAGWIRTVVDCWRSAALSTL